MVMYRIEFCEAGGAVQKKNISKLDVSGAANAEASDEINVARQ